MSLTVKSPDGNQREIQIEAKVKTLEDRRKEREKRNSEKKETPYKCQEINAEAIACKLYTFSVDKGKIDKMMKEIGQHKKLILDLRGNSGGYVDTEMYLTGYFFDRDVKVGDEVTRKKTKERIAKSRKEKAYNGDLVVLIDSDSASAAEVFARVIQLEKRGKIVGDVSAGAVMTSYYYPMLNMRGVPGYETVSLYGVSVTVGDLIMSDGNRLEGMGVIPDYPVGPTGVALAKKTDPILAYAAKLIGAQLTDEKAGEFYFIIKKPEEDENDKSGDDNK